jgi:hypothetical protein
MLTVLSVLSVVAVVAFAGFRQDEFKGQYRRFVDDVVGVVTQARNVAIDLQTQVRVQFQATEVLVTAYDPVDNQWDLVERAALEAFDSALLDVEDKVCIYGLVAGVQTPAQAEDVDPPTDCLGGTQLLLFAPDGTFTDPQNSFSSVANAGATLWIADRSAEGGTRYSVVQVFPGGLVRSFNKVDVPQ